MISIDIKFIINVRGSIYYAINYLRLLKIYNSGLQLIKIHVKWKSQLLEPVE